MSTRYEFGILGPLEVRRDGQPVRIGAAKVRLLLAALLAEANQVVTVETLVHRLWGERPPARARNTLQNYVLRLRRALGCPADGAPVHTRPHGYVIEAAPEDLDLHRFTALVRQGRTALTEGEAARAAPLLCEALALWRGNPLSDLPAQLLQGVVPALDEQRLDALELRIDADLALGRAAAVLPELRGLIGEYPLREHFWAQRMLALFRCGRQGEALECYRTVTALLAEELGVAPGAGLSRLHRRLLAAAPDLHEAGAGAVAIPSREGAPSRDGALARGSDLPAEMTTFVGREVQVAQVRALLGAARLVTLTGAGGVGKTRLALRVAADVAPSFADGVRLADLAPLSDADLLDRAVSEALGLRDQSARPAADTVVGHLRDRRMLLVLDNCEHLVEAVAALVLRLARAAPGLRVLATSRQRLGTPGEHVLTVPSLTLPDTGADIDTDDRADGSTRPRADDPLRRSEAVRLLMDRASGSAPDFRLTVRNRDAVAQLCRRLDGIPLAIELAAVRLSTLTAEEVLERLDDRFRLLSEPRTRTPGRYRQTLRGVVDWSYDLCTEGERLLWNRVSVFSGGFDLEAAEEVCAGEDVTREDVLDLLAGLVDKSIVLVNSSGRRARYSLLETIRQYGAQRLQEEGRTTRLRMRHGEYYRAMAVRAGREWCGPREVDWLVRLRTELPNLRAALDHCASRPELIGAGLEIAVNLARTRCWFFSSTLGEGRHWLERLLAPAPGGPRVPPARNASNGPTATPATPATAVAAPAALVAGALAMKAWIALCQGDDPAAGTFLAECRTVARELADDASPAPVTYIEGAHAMLVRGDPSSVGLLAEARDQFHGIGQKGDAHMATMLWAMAEAFFGDRAAARAARDAYVAEAEASGAEWARTWAQWCTGLVELRHGDADGALVPLRVSLARQRDIGDSWGPVWGLETLAWAVAATGRSTRAAWLLGAAHRMRQDTGVALTGLQPFHEAHASAERRVRAALGAEEYAAAWSRGAAAEHGLHLALQDGRGGEDGRDGTAWSSDGRS